MTNIPNLPIKGFRALRVLRPLKSIRQFPRLRKLISGLLSSIPQLLNALFFMLFCFLQYSIFASQQFGGVNYSRCRLPGGVVNGVWPIDHSQQSLCSKNGDGYVCRGDTVCGEPFDVGLDYHSDHPQALNSSFNDYGITNFNDPLQSLVTIFQCITLEGWSNLMFNLQSQQNGIIVVIFFVFVVILGAFFLIHVILAVVGYSLQQNDMNVQSEANQLKEQIAISLKRREAQLEIDQRIQFLEQVRQQFSSQQQNDEFTFDQDQQKNQVEQQRTEQPELLTERGLLPATEDLAVEVPFNQDQNICQRSDQLSRQTSQISRSPSLNKVVPQEKLRQFPFNSSDSKIPKDSQLPPRARSNRLYRFFYKICISGYFTLVMTLIILANAVTMALEHYPQPESFTYKMYCLNQMFSWIFTLEMIIKVTGLGIREYIRDSFNIFDAIIVILSLVDNILLYSVGNSASGGGVIVLRSIRLLRVFKLARNWTSLRILIVQIVDTLPNLASFAFLLFIFQVVFIILGLQFFAGTVYIDQNDKIVDSSQGNPPLNNFENLYNASTTVFAVMMIDNWNQMMYQYYRGMGIKAMIFFICTIITLNIVLLNLFLALFLESFENPKAANDSQTDQEFSGLTQTQEKLLNFVRLFLKKLPTFFEKNFGLLKSLDQLETYLNQKDEQSEKDSQESEDLTYRQSLKRLGSVHLFEKEVCEDWKLSEAYQKTEERKKLLSIAQLVKNETLVEIVKQQQKKDVKATGVSLWLFTPENILRRACLFIFNLAHFENFSNLMVLFSTVLLTVDNPLDNPNSTKQFVLNILDYITTGIFTIEASIKIIVFGALINGKSSYLREPWNILDLFVVCISLFSYLPLGFNIQFYKSMRLLRILRPLRMIQRNQGLKIAIKSLLNVLPSVVNLLMISGINLGLLSVLGTNLFKGTFYSCNFNNIPHHVKSKINNSWECQDYGGEWQNSDQHFDNFWSSCSSVFQIMTTEGWYQLATQAQMSTNIFQMPYPQASQATFLYFVIVIFIQSLFMGNLFISVVITTFRQEKERLSNNTQLTQLELEYIETCIKCFKIKPQKVFTQKDLIRKLCHQITDSKIFKNFILVCIVANTFLFACTWYGQEEITSERIEYFNLALSIVYFIEFLMKLVALRMEYFEDGWNQLDLFIVLSIVAGYAVKYLSNGNVMIALAVVRIFRVTRLLKLIRQLKLLRRCFQTFIESAPEIFNIGSLLILFLFMFSILGMNLFANVQLQSNLNNKVNFQSFWTAFLTLFITCTGENWPYLQSDVSRQRSITFQCLESQTYHEMQKYGIKGCGQPLGQAFFPIFQTIMSFVMLNLFSAIILEGFQKELLDELQKIRQETLDMFQNLWKKYDPGATGMIAIEDLSSFLLDFVDQEMKMNSKTPLKKQKISDEIFFNFRHKKLLTLSAIWRKQEDDGSQDYYNLKNSQFFQKQLDSHLQKFIGELEIPSYKKFQCYCFYDVLNGFVNFSFTQRRKYQCFQRKSLIAKLKETKQTLSKLDSIELYSKEFYKLSRIEKETLEELETENFINVIHRIERKGKRQEKQILKLKLMQELRRRNILQYKETLDQLEGQVVSSKLLVAVKTITGFVAVWRARNLAKKREAQLISDQLNAIMKSEPLSATKLNENSKVLSNVSSDKNHPTDMIKDILKIILDETFFRTQQLTAVEIKQIPDQSLNQELNTQIDAQNLSQKASNTIETKTSQQNLSIFRDQEQQIKLSPKMPNESKNRISEGEISSHQVNTSDFIRNQIFENTNVHKVIKRGRQPSIAQIEISNKNDQIQGLDRFLSDEVVTLQDAPFCSPDSCLQKAFKFNASPQITDQVVPLTQENQFQIKMRALSSSLEKVKTQVNKQSQLLRPTYSLQPIRHGNEIFTPKFSVSGQIKLQKLPEKVIKQSTFQIYSKQKFSKKISDDLIHKKILVIDRKSSQVKSAQQLPQTNKLCSSKSIKHILTPLAEQTSTSKILAQNNNSKRLGRIKTKQLLPPLPIKNAFKERYSDSSENISASSLNVRKASFESSSVSKTSVI